MDRPPNPQPAKSPARPAPKRRFRVAAVGDSLTSKKSGGGKYLTYLSELCPESHFEDFGVGGEMVNQMKRRFEPQVIGSHRAAKSGNEYTHVIVFGGVNDLYSDLTAGRTVNKISGDLSAMYQSAKQAGISVVAVTVTPWGGFKRYFNQHRAQTTLQLNHWILGQAGKLVDVAVDAYPLLSCGDPQKLCPEYAKPFKDGLHFGPEGHRVLARALHENAFANCL